VRGGYPIPLRDWLDGEARQHLATVRSEWVSEMVREALASVVVLDQEEVA